MAKKHLPHKVAINPEADLGLKCVGGLRRCGHERARPAPEQGHTKQHQMLPGEGPGTQAQIPYHPPTPSTPSRQLPSTCPA